MTHRQIAQARRGLWAWGCVLLLGACGGGGGGGTEAPPATPLPTTLSISAPAKAESAESLQFDTPAAAAAGLDFRWDFGDGGQSSEHSPKHSYAKAGDFEVVLTISNAAGQSREARSRVTVTNLANVRGLVCSGADNSGWCYQSPLPYEKGANDAFFLNPLQGWRVSGGHELFRTSDGGVHWEKLSFGAPVNINTLAFLDDTVGWAGGDQLMRTSNGGRDWLAVTPLDALGSKAVRIKIINPNSVYVQASSCPDNSFCMVTTDAGQSWRKLNPAPKILFADGGYWALRADSVVSGENFGRTDTTWLDFPTRGIKHDYAAAGAPSFAADGRAVAALATRELQFDPGATAWLWKVKLSITRDFGRHWDIVEPSCLGETSELCDSFSLLSVSNAGRTLLAKSAHSLYLSDDGGVTWSKLGITPAGQSLATQRLPATQAYQLDPIVAYSSSGLYSPYLTADGGKTWTQIRLPWVYYATVGELELLGSRFMTYKLYGFLYLSKDGGLTWSRLVEGVPPETFGADPTPTQTSFRDAKRGFFRDRAGTVRETSDGGLSWLAPRNALVQGASDVFLLGDKLGWMRKGGTLYRSADGGDNWQALPLAQHELYEDFGFDSETRGWRRRPFPYGGNAPLDLRGQRYSLTEDGGQTWRDLTVPGGTWAASFAAIPGAYLAVGEGGSIAISTDKGASWTHKDGGVTTATLNGVAASDAGTLWVIGSEGVLLKSVDAGQSWARVALANGTGLAAIKFASSKVGWIVGNYGLVLATTDGGATWRQQARLTSQNLTGIDIADSKTAWITGTGNVLLATGSGGE